MEAIRDPRPAQTLATVPSGTVTFVFTDVEASAQRWERYPAAMHAALLRQEQLLRAAIAAHGGHVFKTIGDAICAAFSRPQDAVAAMVRAQRALSAEDFREVDGVAVRAAIHTGMADEREGDYFGPTVNRVARLLATAHGGQVIMSNVVAELVQEVLPAEASLRDLGQHRLKDLATPERVYQVLAPELRAEFPALRSLNAVPNNLPLLPTSFIGRDSEVTDITALIEQHRLVTLVGSGGVGKTRTALQVAANVLERWGDGVWFVEFAPLSGGEYLSSTVAQALGITLAAGGDAVANLTRALASRQLLLVLDNCEHLVEAAARVSLAILRACPQVKILATSREGLRIAGEAAYRLPSLSLPSAVDGEPLSTRDVSRYAALALFSDRARAVDHRFAIDDANVGPVAEICRRLDGIPLAIELAAARITLLSPRQLAQRLDERFRVLTGGSRNVLPRQQTLRALIDWSHDLLDDHERVLFRRLSIFANGFSLEGAAAVGTPTQLDELDAFDGLASLVDKSLVLAEAAGEDRRYRFLESTRAYALEQLDASGERTLCAGLHLRFLRDRFEAAFERVERSDRPTELLELCAAEIDNVRAALAFALRGTDPRPGAELLAAVWTGWKNLGLDGEGLALCEAFLRVLAPNDARLCARLWDVIRQLSGGTGRTTHAFDAAANAVAFARSANDADVLASALTGYSYVAGSLGHLDRAEEALREAEALPGVSKRQRRIYLHNRAMLSRQRGDLAAAAWAHEQLRRTHRANGNAINERKEMINLAEIEHIRGHTAKAVSIAREALPGFRADTDRSSFTGFLTNLAGYLMALDDIETGCSTARDALRELAGQDSGSPLSAFAIEHLALGLALRGDLERAARLAGHAAAVLEKQGGQRDFTERTTHERLTVLLRDRLASQLLDRAFAAGTALTSQAALALALQPP